MQPNEAGLLGLLQSCNIDALLTPIDGKLFKHMVLPSTWFRLLHRDHPRQFKLSLGASIPRLRQFWGKFLTQPATRAWADVHPFLRNRTLDDLESTIPCTIHIDGAPCSKLHSFLSVSFSSLVRNADQRSTQFVCATCVKPSRSECCDVMWETLLADMDSLATGVVNGTDVARSADGTRWKMVLLVAKADEEQRCNEFKLPHYSSDEPCSECTSNRSTRPFTDLRACAAWRSGEDMPFEFYKARLGAPLHPLARSHYFCNRWFSTWTPCTCWIARV